MDNKTVAFVDFTGNKQYITVGNLTTNPNIALIMVLYPHKERLKLYAKAKIVQLSENPGLFSLIDTAGYKHRLERMIVLDIEVYDWNCPQHIVPRYTTEEIEQALAPQRKYMAELEADNNRLKAKLEKSGKSAT